MTFEVPFLSESQIRIAAYSFLTRHHPSEEIPIPISEIVECKLDIKIIPIDRLYVDFGYSAFLSTDLQTITVDERQYLEFTQKCRFSFAHEMGHLVLHPDFYKNLPFTDIASYKEWLLSMDRRELNRAEWQADQFAGFLLVPGPQLLRVCRAVVKANENYLEEAKERGLAGNEKEIWAILARDVAEEFDVSPRVVEIRIQNEGIAETINLFQ